MNKFILLTFFLLLTISSKSQSVLMVNDNDVNTQNSADFLALLQNTSYTISSHNAVTSGAPDLATLQSYDLIVWYTSSDGVGLSFWDEGSSGNQDLKNYLNGGGKLWMVGLDFLFSNYGAAPDNFMTSDFVYDYLGINSYNVQSYADDGSNGVPQMDLVSSSSFPNNLTWIFSTLWYADGVDLVTGAESIYEMGPSSYSLSGEVSMLHYNTSTTNALTTLFDPITISVADRQSFVESSLDFLSNSNLDTTNAVSNTNKQTLTVLYNKSNNKISIQLKNNDLLNETYYVYNASGKLIDYFKESRNSFDMDVSSYVKGMYIIKINNLSKKFIIH